MNLPTKWLQYRLENAFTQILKGRHPIYKQKFKTSIFFKVSLYVKTKKKKKKIERGREK